MNLWPEYCILILVILIVCNLSMVYCESNYFVCEKSLFFLSSHVILRPSRNPKIISIASKITSKSGDIAQLVEYLSRMQEALRLFPTPYKQTLVEKLTKLNVIFGYTVNFRLAWDTWKVVFNQKVFWFFILLCDPVWL